MANRKVISMKRLAALVVVAPLMGCGPSFPTIDSAALTEAVSQVQGYTVKICSYLPSNESVIGILTSAHPALETAYALATQICEAVTASAPAINPAQLGEERRGDENQCPMVRGVCVEGQFLTQPSKPETGASTMSKELDERVDSLRNRLVKQAANPINMGNARQQLRADQEMMLELINITDAVNAQHDVVSPGVMDKLKSVIRDLLAKPEGA